MGGYVLSGKEIVKDFEKFLKKTSSGDGDITAETIAEAYNILSSDNGWYDELSAEGVSCPKCGDPSGWSNNYCAVCGYNAEKDSVDGCDPG